MPDDVVVFAKKLPEIDFDTLAPGFFWAAARSLGSDPKEIQAAAVGQIAEDRAAELRARTAMAKIALRDMPVPGVRAWMFWTRAYN